MTQAKTRIDRMSDIPSLIHRLRTLGRPGDCEDAAQELERLRADNEALRRDAERMDWLEAHDGDFFNLDRVTATVGKGFVVGIRDWRSSLREAIDAALADQQEPPR